MAKTRSYSILFYKSETLYRVILDNLSCCVDVNAMSAELSTNQVPSLEYGFR